MIISRALSVPLLECVFMMLHPRRTPIPQRTTHPSPGKSLYGFCSLRRPSQSCAVRYRHFHQVVCNHLRKNCLSCFFICLVHPGAEFQWGRPVSAGPALHQFQDGQLEPLQPHLRQSVLLKPGEGRPLWGQPGCMYLALV